MHSPIKDFASLKPLRKALKEKEEQKRREENERRRKEEEARREADFFRSNVGDVVPLDFSDRVVLAVPKPQPVPQQRINDNRRALQESLTEPFTVDTLLEIDADASFKRDGISQEIVRKLRRGHWIIQDELDLHGQRRDEAREVLSEFLKRSILRGFRCVRIVHGKGLGSINQEPVLKKLVYGWLSQKEEVLAFAQAKGVDGGSGALMVLLKGK